MINEIKENFQKILPKGYESVKLHCLKTLIYTNFLIEDLPLSKNEKKEILIAAYLHDIGKMKIPESILNKKDKLTESEYSLIKKHSEIGYGIVLFLDAFYNNKNEKWSVIKNKYDMKIYDISFEKIGKYVLQHHEKFDGSGYPYGLKKDEISLYSQIISLADVYDALTENRPYRPPLPVEKAFEIILSEKEKQFNPDVVDLFISKYYKFIEFKKQTENLSSSTFKKSEETNPFVKQFLLEYLI
ncbi:MAG: HD domain-containing protein [Thermofilaceae archaeon]